MLGLMRVLSLFPFSWQLFLGRILGLLCSPIARYRLRIALVNICLCFPDWSPPQQKQLLREHCAALGMGLFETALAWWGSDKRVARLVEMEGMSHLKQALAQGKGVILLTAHFVHLELGARFIALQQPLHALYRPHRNPLFERFVYHKRLHHGQLPPIDRKDMRGLLRSLKQGHVVWYAPDQNYGPKHSVLAPFFNVHTLTVTATSRLARLSGAPVVPYCVERLPGKANYRVTVLPPLNNFPSVDLTTDAVRINRLVESWVRRAPEQYLWIHRRFKGGSAGLEKLYSIEN
jgi:KDO2-lipid IV(A) lauroyltransferase